MAADDWNFLAGRLNGDGFVTDLIGELPITISSIDRNLSAPSSMAGSITNEVRRLKRNDGSLLLEPGNTLLIAEASGIIKGMGIYQKPQFTGPSWSLSTIGLPGYAIGLPYVGEEEFIYEDPLNIFRAMWANIQAQPHGNLGITIDPLLSGLKVGNDKKQVDFTTRAGERVTFEAGPRKLNWYQTQDLGAEVDRYAKASPFDWLETNYWEADDQPHCHIKLGYPTIGVQRTHPRFELGVNLATEPTFVSSDYVNQVIVLGAGEGRDRIRGYAGISDGRLRKVKTIENTSIEKLADANALAKETLALTRGELIVETLEVWDHPDMPLETFELGNEYPLSAETPHLGEVYTTVRLIARSDAPGGEEKATFTVIRPGVA